MENPVETALVHEVDTTEDDNLQKKRMSNIYRRHFNYLLATLATNNVIARSEAVVTSLKRREYMSAITHPVVFWKKQRPVFLSLK